MTVASPGALAFHRLANLFPMMPAADQDALGADMAANGTLDRIVMLDGAILDGRNRYCQIVKRDLDPPTADWRADARFVAFAEVSNGMAPLEWVLSKNLNRRHLDESQRSVVAGRIADLKQGRPSRSKTPVDDKPANLPVSRIDGEPEEVGAAGKPLSMTQGAAAEALHVSERSVRDARKVLDHGAEGLVELVETGAVAVSAAARVADLPVEQQAELISAADPKAFARVAKERRAEGQAKKTARRVDPEREKVSVAAVEQVVCPHCGAAFPLPTSTSSELAQGTSLDKPSSGGSPTPDTGAADSASLAAAPDPSPQQTTRSRKAEKSKPALPPAREIAAGGLSAIVRFGTDTIQFYAVDKTPFPTEIGMVEISRAEAGGHLGADDPLPDDLNAFAGAIFETLLGDEKDRRIPITLYRLGRTGPVPVRGE